MKPTIERFRSLLISICTLVLAACGREEIRLPASTEPLRISLPPGFQLEVFADNVPDARSLCLGPGGIVFVGSRIGGKVHALVDGNKDGKIDEVVVVMDGLEFPNGVAFKDGALYVAAFNRILRFPDIAENFRTKPRPELITADFPTERYHEWKFIAFGPDGKLYVPVGAPCNVCERPEPFACIVRMNADGSEREIFARGVRNTVGFDWHPITKELWFTDNGRDLWADHLPPDELNRAPEAGLHFGFPYCHGNGLQDPELKPTKDCSEFTGPALELGAHVAALGMRFYTGEQFPVKYRGGIFIAEHGSWNRKDPLGYRIMFVNVENDKATSYEPFAQGWLRGSEVLGRPVDVLVMPDGALLVSDDKAGKVYRISHNAAAERSGENSPGSAL
jgi:glucose/arabinose dehydrogenase